MKCFSSFWESAVRFTRKSKRTESKLPKKMHWKVVTTLLYLGNIHLNFELLTQKNKKKISSFDWHTPQSCLSYIEKLQCWQKLNEQIYAIWSIFLFPPCNNKNGFKSTHWNIPVFKFWFLILFNDKKNI